MRSWNYVVNGVGLLVALHILWRVTGDESPFFVALHVSRRIALRIAWGVALGIHTRSPFAGASGCRSFRRP